MSNLPTVPLADIERMAVYVAESKMFPGIDTKQKAASLMLLAQAEGLHPMTATRRYHMMEFKGNAVPTLKAEVMLANFQAADGAIEVQEYTDRKVTIKFTHPKGGSVTITWDDERVKAAGLGNLHHKFGAAMKRSRCISEGVRTIYPGCLHGMYTPEEMVDVIEGELIPTSPRKPAKKLEAPNVPSLPDVAPTPEAEPLDRSAQADYTKELGAMLRALINPETVANEIKARYELKGKLTEVTDLATRYNILADLNEALASQKESLEAA
jgi:hypothetical protein